MLKKIADQIYKLKGGQYFDVHFRGYYFRVNAVNILKSNSIAYGTIIIVFDDDTQIVSKPSESTNDLVNKFFSKVESLHSLRKEDLTEVSDICSYEN